MLHVAFQPMKGDVRDGRLVCTVKTFPLVVCGSRSLEQLCRTRRKMFVIGLCITIDSAIYLSEQLILGDGLNGTKLKYMLTYKLSQDHIEIMFSVIRHRGGWSNNPTALQFQAAYRAVLSHVGVVPSEGSNCITGLADDILVDSTDDEATLFAQPTVDACAPLPLLSLYTENVSSYIAGFVVRRLLPKLKCSECRELLVDPTNIFSLCCAFFMLRDNGGLIVPSAGVVSVVHSTERHLRSLVPQDKTSVHTLSRLGIKLELAVLNDIDCLNVFGCTTHHTDTAEGIDNHVSSLVRQVVRFYLDIRIFHIAGLWNVEQKGKVIRQSMTKLILFKNQ